MNDFMDVTYSMDDTLLIYPGDPVFKKESFLSIGKEDMCNVGNISMGCHTGTHMDAPLHFVDGGTSIDAVDLDLVNGSVRVIAYAGDFADTRDINRRFLESCHISPGERVIFKTENSSRFAGVHLLEDYTAIDLEAASYLAEIGVKCIGIDYLTVEPVDSREGKVHKALLGAGIPLIETLDLRQVTPGIYRLHCLPLKLAGMDGSPVRAVLERGLATV